MIQDFYDLMNRNNKVGEILNVSLNVNFTLYFAREPHGSLQCTNNNLIAFPLAQWKIKLKFNGETTQYSRLSSKCI